MSQVARKKRSPWMTCLLVVVIIGTLSVCGMVVLGGIGAYLYSTGTVTLNDILNIANLGPAEIQLVNLSDGRIDVDLRFINEEDDSTSHFDSASLEPFDMAAFRSISKGRYELIFEVPNGLPPNDTCNLNVKGGSFYHVAVVPEGIVIVLEGEKVTSVEEVNMATSPLCGR
jgi:hypothetical protein